MGCRKAAVLLWPLRQFQLHPCLLPLPAPARWFMRQQLLVHEAFACWFMRQQLLVHEASACWFMRQRLMLQVVHSFGPDVLPQATQAAHVQPKTTPLAPAGGALIYHQAIHVNLVKYTCIHHQALHVKLIKPAGQVCLRKAYMEQLFMQHFTMQHKERANGASLKKAN